MTTTLTEADLKWAQALEPEYNTTRPDWTPDLVRLANSEANGGKLEAAADLCDALRSDARLRGVIQTRVNALLGSKLSFEENGDKRRNSQVIRALEIEGEFWEMYEEAALSQVFTWGLLLNIGLAEIVWERNVLRGGIWQQRLIPKHPRNLRYDFDECCWYLRVLKPGELMDEEIKIVPGDGRWLIFSPFGTNSPWAHGLWFPLALVWLTKSYAGFDWDRRNESRGRSAMVGSTPEGSGDKDRIEFARQIALLRTQLGIALPPGYDLKSVEFGGDDHGTFDVRIQSSESAYAIIILGQNLTTEVKSGGSYAAGRSQERVRQDYLEQDAESFSTCLHHQLLIYFAMVRFSDGLLAPYPKWDTEPQENLINSANVIARATEALDRMLARNVPVDLEAYMARFKIPMTKNWDGKLVTGPTKVSAPPSKDDAKDDEEKDEESNGTRK